MSPPTIGVPVQVRIPTDELVDLDQRAEAAGISRSELVRHYISDGLMRDARRAARRGK